MNRTAHLLYSNLDRMWLASIRRHWATPVPSEYTRTLLQSSRKPQDHSNCKRLVSLSWLWSCPAPSAPPRSEFFTRQGRPGVRSDTEP